VASGFNPFEIQTTATTGISGTFATLTDEKGKTLTNAAIVHNGQDWTDPITVT
jgi:hypothetical protein